MESSTNSRVNRISLSYEPFKGKDSIRILKLQPAESTDVEFLIGLGGGEERIERSMQGYYMLAEKLSWSKLAAKPQVYAWSKVLLGLEAKKFLLRSGSRKISKPFLMA